MSDESDGRVVLEYNVTSPPNDVIRKSGEVYVKCRGESVAFWTPLRGLQIYPGKDYLWHLLQECPEDGKGSAMVLRRCVELSTENMKG